MKKFIISLTFILCIFSACCQKTHFILHEKTIRGESLPDGFMPMDSFSIDYNNDSHLDFLMFEMQFPPTFPETYKNVRLIKNNGNGELANVTTEVLGDVKSIHARHVSLYDLNNDGFQDFIFADHGTDVKPFPGAKSKVFINQQGKSFKQISANKFSNEKAFTFHASMADINNDGLGDIYLNNSPFMTHNPAPAVFIQDQTGKFTKKNNLLPSVLFSGRVFLASHFFDFDNDGDQDLFLGGADGRDEKNKKDVLLINEKGVLRESSFHLPDRLEDHRWGTVSVSSSDLNNDGYQDLVLSVHNAGFSKGKLQILMNSKGQKFTEIKVNLDFKYESSGYWIPWTAIGDLNNDGFDDIVFSVRSKRPTGYRPIKILLSDSGKEFNDISKQSPAIDNHINGVHLIDFNNDKFLDILITTYSEKYYIYENMKKW